MTTAIDDPEQVLHFWLGELDADGFADDEHQSRWWRKDPAFDQLIRDRFAELHEAVRAGRRDDWLAAARSRLAFIVVLDQLSRNMFRGSERMHAGDARARDAAADGIERGMDRALPHHARSFFYMPLMHSEALADQELCVELVSGWRDEVSGRWRERVAQFLPYAEQHRDIVRRFGRFPHRNAILGRASTPEEVAFLTQPGSSF